MKTQGKKMDVLDSSYLTELFENAQEAMVVTDTKGIILRVNQRFIKLFGFSSKEAIGQREHNLLAPLHLQKRGALFNKIAAKGEEVSLDTVRQKKDGTSMDVSVLASPLKRNGSVSAAFAIYRDISARKKIEQALERKIEFNKILSSISTRFVTFSDFDKAINFSLSDLGRFIDADRASIFLFRENESVADNCYEWYSRGRDAENQKSKSLDLNRFSEWIKRLPEKGIFRLKDSSGSSQGGLIEEEILNDIDAKSVIALPLKIRGRLAGFIGFFNPKESNEKNNGDPTLLCTASGIIANAIERKWTEDSLRESEDKYRSLVERANDGIAVIQAGKIIFTNSRLAEMWGGSVDDLMDRRITDLVHPNEISKVLDRYEKRMAGQTVPPIYETIMKHKDGSDVLVELNAGMIPYQGDCADLVLVRDISERKQAQTWRNVLEGSIQAIAMTLEMRDPYTAGHQQRVTRLACAIAKEMGLPEDQIEGLYFAGLIHDIGKVTIPAEILSKPGKLTETEFSIIKNHPEVAFDIVKNIDFPWPVARIVLQHHEYIDGSGYPQGLKGDQIMIEAKILTVADVVEAMASHRPYRPAMGIDKALDEIKFGKGMKYDPKAAEACVRLFEEKGLTLK